MSLNEFWFLLVAVLFIGFFFLEGFDFGVGMSMRFLAKDEKERTMLVSTIGPFWDANEVWLITAGVHCLLLFQTGMRQCSVVTIYRYLPF